MRIPQVRLRALVSDEAWTQLKSKLELNTSSADIDLKKLAGVVSTFEDGGVDRRRLEALLTTTKTTVPTGVSAAVAAPKEQGPALSTRESVLLKRAPDAKTDADATVKALSDGGRATVKGHFDADGWFVVRIAAFDGHRVEVRADVDETGADGVLFLGDSPRPTVVSSNTFSTEVERKESGRGYEALDAFFGTSVDGSSTKQDDTYASVRGPPGAPVSVSAQHIETTVFLGGLADRPRSWWRLELLPASVVSFARVPCSAGEHFVVDYSEKVAQDDKVAVFFVDALTERVTRLGEFELEGRIVAPGSGTLVFEPLGTHFGRSADGKLHVLRSYVDE